MKKLINFASIVFAVAIAFAIGVFGMRILPSDLDIELYLGIMLLICMAVLCVGAVVYAFTFTFITTITTFNRNH